MVNSAARSFILALAACLGSVVLFPGDAAAADPKKSREKMVELNKQALFFYQSKDWKNAKDLLSEAIDEAEVAGLDGNKMTARTYLHLGAVYWVGFHDREAALQNFSMAKSIRPDIQLTPLIETPELKALFDAALEQVGAVSSDVSAIPTPMPLPTRGARTFVGAPRFEVDGGDGEPDLPTRMSAPLMCTIPIVASPRRDLALRCAVQPGLNASLVQLHYRSRGFEAYQAQDLQRTPKGWYVVTLARDAMRRGGLQVYFDAFDAAGNRVANIGDLQSPSVISVRERSSLDEEGPGEDPLREIKERARADAYESGLHRRREGSLWLGMGAGVGWAYAPAGNLEWERNVRISAVRGSTGLFHLAPELGYMVSDSFALALQGRIQFIRQEQAVYEDPLTGHPQQLVSDRPGSPATMASAIFMRAIGYADLSRSGNLRFAYSGDIGGGYVRLPVPPTATVHYDSETDQNVVDPDRTIAKTDTRPVGAFLFGTSIGISWNLSGHFALAWNARVLSGLPSWGAVVESTLSAQLAFGGSGGEASLPEEDAE